MKDIFDEIKNKAKPVLERPPVLFAYLYGSAISGSRTPLSDIDIGLAVSKDVIADEYLDLELSIEAELGRALALSKLDVRIINAAPLRFKAQVVQTGRIIFSKDESARVSFETTVRDQYFDFMPKIKQVRDAFLEKLRKEGILG